jgi:hypothetical protein
MMKSKKINVVVEGIKMSLPAEVVKFRNDGVTPYVWGRGPIASSMVKQFVKAKYPNVVCSVKSASFANGNSLDVYVSNPNGSEVEVSIYNDINRFANQFEYGKYNGMDETYDYYENSGVKTEKGMDIEAGVKYVHTNNKPMFGSVGDCVRMLNAMVAGEYVWGPLTIEKAIEKILAYKVPQTNIDKALVYVK